MITSVFIEFRFDVAPQVEHQRISKICTVYFVMLVTLSLVAYRTIGSLNVFQRFTHLFRVVLEQRCTGAGVGAGAGVKQIFPKPDWTRS